MPDEPQLQHYARRNLLRAGAGLFLLGGVGASAYWALNSMRNPCASRRDLAHEVSASLRERLWLGIDPKAFIDMHVHVVGDISDVPGAESWVNPEMTRLYNPFLFAHFATFADASCAIGHASAIGAAYVERLADLVDEFPDGARFLLLALDGWHDESGAWLPKQTVLRVSNHYVAGVARQHGDRFAWAASIHPYRKDAIGALEKAASEGASAVKWIPFLMGIDPSSPKCDPFYARMAALRLPLIVHSGWQHALIPGADQEWGNPLRLRRPLEAGVTVIAAHCATQGDMRDDDLEGAPQVPAFHLLRRLIDEPRYRGKLFGDISGVVSTWREPEMIRELVLDERWRGRLVNGSDYPLPGAPVLTSAPRLVELGFLDPEDSRQIAHIQGHNPLLFDFALKRLLRIDGRPFDASVFQSRTIFDVARNGS